MVRENRAVSGDKIINRKTNPKQVGRFTPKHMVRENRIIRPPKSEHVVHNAFGRMSKFNKSDHKYSANSILSKVSPKVKRNYKKHFKFRDPTLLSLVKSDDRRPNENAVLKNDTAKIHYIHDGKIIATNKIKTKHATAWLARDGDIRFLLRATDEDVVEGFVEIKSNYSQTGHISYDNYFWYGELPDHKTGFYKTLYNSPFQHDDKQKETLLMRAMLDIDVLGEGNDNLIDYYDKM